MVLLSDLEILPDEVQRLVTVFADLRRDGFDVQIVPLGAREERRELVEQLLGGDALLPEPVSGEEAVAGAVVRKASPPACRSRSSLVGSILVLVLAANERMLARLEVSR